MLKVLRIMVHCTGEPSTARRNKEYYRHLFFDVKHWTHYGYHAIVYQDGRWEVLQPLPTIVNGYGIITNDTRANGCNGANDSSIHIAYVGGLDHVTRKPADTRTDAQKQTLWALVAMWKMQYNITEVIGHRDWVWVTKACPCFDAKSTYRDA